MNAPHLRDRVRFVLTLFFAALVPAFGALAGIGRPPSESSPYEREIAALRNGDLRWETFGQALQPICRKAEYLSLAYTPSPAIDYLLLKSLRDPERYQIAHALLTMRSGKPWPVSADTWNGLPLVVLRTTDEAGPVMIALYDRWVIELESRRQSLRIDASLPRPEVKP